MIKNIIFDWDGVLKDSFSKFYETTKIMFKKLGKEPISIEEIKKTFNTPYMEFWNHHFPDLDEEKEKLIYYEAYTKTKPVELYKGAIETINKLKERKIRMFIVSSSLMGEIFPDLEKNNTLGAFEKIVYEVHEKETDINRIIEDYNLDRNETAIISDTTGDINYGKKTNIKTIAITWGFQTRERLSTVNPDIIIDDIKELVEVIDKEKL